MTAKENIIDKVDRIEEVDTVVVVGICCMPAGQGSVEQIIGRTGQYGQYKDNVTDVERAISEGVSASEVNCLCT